MTETGTNLLPSAPFGVPPSGAPVEPNDSDQLVPIGGRLLQYYHHWEASQPEPWILRTVTHGLQLEFLSNPPERFIRCRIPPSQESRQLMLAEIQHLLAINAIETVPPDQRGRGFYSTLFLVSKSSGGWRGVLNLKHLNKHILYRRFKMHSLRSILSCIRRGDLLQSVDLKEAYLHVPIHQDHRRFLRFEFNHMHYQYCAMPFGLSSAPRTFTKLVAVVAAQLRRVPVRLLCYLDDVLILSTSLQSADLDRAAVLQAFQQHGFTVNLEKSHLSPTTKLCHLGTLIDTRNCQVFLSQDRVESIVTLVRQVLAQKRASPLLLSQLGGKMVSCIDVVPWARRHMRPLQWLLLPYQRAKKVTSKLPIQVPARVLMSLRWWASPALRKGCSFLEPDRLVLTTDASLQGWGAHLLDQVTQGRWSPQERKRPINWLELRAVHLALKHFEAALEQKHVLILTDNVATKAHVNREGGTRSRSLMAESEALLAWAERHVLSLRAEHISGQDNIYADWLSRETLDESEWQLLPSLFREIVQRFGLPCVDLFASHQNAQLARYFTRFQCTGAEGTDALRCNWPAGLLYAFPPLPLIPRVIRKMLRERAELILVAPRWPKRAWYADLVERSVAPSWTIPPVKVDLIQGVIHHPEPQWLRLTVWRLSGSS